MISMYSYYVSPNPRCKHKTYGSGNYNCNAEYFNLVDSHCYYNSLNMLDLDSVHAHDIYNTNRVRILVAGVETSALIDSGASVSVIDRHFF